MYNVDYNSKEMITQKPCYHLIWSHILYIWLESLNYTTKVVGI